MSLTLSKSNTDSDAYTNSEQFFSQVMYTVRIYFGKIVNLVLQELVTEAVPSKGHLYDVQMHSFVSGLGKCLYCPT